MSTGAIALERTTTPGRSGLVAFAVALALALAITGAGLQSGVPIPVLAGATAFLFLAVASDVRSHRVPNLLTLPALLAALVLSPWLGATSGPLEAALGAALGFGLLLVPYAIGGMGAGDVKGLMALGAWLGPAETLGTAAWAVIAGGGIGLVLLVLRGELPDFARRWGRTLLGVFTLRRLDYEAPAAGSTAADGIPFAVALAVGLTAQWIGGSPW